MLNTLSSLRLDIVCWLASALLIAAYHLYVHIRLQRDPTYTIQSINALSRTNWVKTIMRTSGRELLAVQTLRNSTMACTFLASTSVLLIMGALNLANKHNILPHPLASLATGDLWDAKLACLLCAFFIAFLCFTLAIRMIIHVGFLVNAGPTSDQTSSPRYVAHLLNRGFRYYTIGMRAYYLSVPMVFWLFSPILMLVAAMLMVPVLYHVDRAPDDHLINTPYRPDRFGPRNPVTAGTGAVPAMAVNNLSVAEPPTAATTY